MGELFVLLQELSAAGLELQVVGETEDTSAKLAVVQRVVIGDTCIKEAYELACEESGKLWNAMQHEKIILADITRAFAAVMMLSSDCQALHAASVYTSLLKSPGCPVSVLLS